jgi:hypothetical protein
MLALLDLRSACHLGWIAVIIDDDANALFEVCDHILELYLGREGETHPSGTIEAMCAASFGGDLDLRTLTEVNAGF